MVQSAELNPTSQIPSPAEISSAIGPIVATAKSGQNSGPSPDTVTSVLRPGRIAAGNSVNNAAIPNMIEPLILAS